MQQKNANQLIYRRLVWSHAPLQRRSAVRRCDGYVQVIPDLKALRLQGHGIICALPTRHRVTNLLNSTAKQTQELSKETCNGCYAKSRLFHLPVHRPFWVWEYDGEGKMCAFLSGLRINLFHQAGKFFKGGIHPVMKKITRFQFTQWEFPELQVVEEM